MEKVRLLEDGWNSRYPVKVAAAYSLESRWRNRAELVGRPAVEAFLAGKWAKELDRRLMKEEFGAEIVLTNVGSPDIELEFGDLRLEDVLGPLGFEHEQSIGIAQLGGRIHFSYTSFHPQPAIPQGLRIALSRLVEPSPVYRKQNSRRRHAPPCL